MIDYCQKLVTELDEENYQYSTEIADPIQLVEKLIEITLHKISMLKAFIKDKGFEKQEEEIYFFKELKPKIVSKLIYHNAIYKIESRRPAGGEKNIKKYLNNELSKLKRFFENNLDFYKYYRTNSIYLDHKYFIRGNFDIKFNLDTYFFESDHSFSTSHDYKVSKIIANDLIQVYLEDKLMNFGNQPKLGMIREHELKWTASKSALTELIYALNAYGTFNEGRADIKEISRAFESLFHIDLGNIYHIYLEIKNRKINKVKFLDQLREELLKRMEDTDSFS
ncbi:RteC domain-containing protein [Elizabethkingia anophelis]|uniref:RteC domain-containing protein n=1 Tax=Elizabethkingia anophelis TaxID=1117645 RepID=UPI0021A8A265|nr:RteC domain-containing protein [Elizabethkingia anophelis]MDV4069968.1 tetracycline regulation of excision, RteC [Elizabethkingia anophelis]